MPSSLNPPTTTGAHSKPESKTATKDDATPTTPGAAPTGRNFMACSRPQR